MTTRLVQRIWETFQLRELLLEVGIGIVIVPLEDGTLRYAARYAEQNDGGLIGRGIGQDFQSPRTRTALASGHEAIVPAPRRRSVR